MSERATKGFAIRLRAPWDEDGTYYVVAKNRGSAVSYAVQTLRDHLSPDIGYQSIVSANRYTWLDGEREGFHERVIRNLGNGVLV